MSFRIGVVGAGTMGGGIARCLAEAGCEVVLQTRKPEAAAGLVRGFLRRARRHRAGPAPGSLRVTGDFTGFGDRELVIEAVSETRDTKRAVLARVEDAVAPTTILATNTSSLPLDELAGVLTRPEQLVAAHFFHPVRFVRLVEVAGTATTAPQALARTLEILTGAARMPWRVPERPGLIVNRILFPALHEALRMLEEGTASATEIDSASTALGISMGPCTTLDLLGLDVLLAMCFNFEKTLGPAHRAPALLEALVAADRLGRKNGRGIYRYSGGKMEPDPELAALRPSPTSGAASRFDVERLRFGMLKEALVCVVEGLAPAAEIESAVREVMGAQRGPLGHAAALGAAPTLARFDALAAEFGARFSLTPELRRALASRSAIPTGLEAAA